MASLQNINEYLIKKYSAFEKYLFKPSGDGIKAILTYHGVSTKAKKNCIKLDYFINHLNYLSNFFKIISLSKLIDNISGEANDNRNLVAITFDDAYQNFKEYAYLELKRRNIPVTLFVPVGYVGHMNAWDCDSHNDKDCQKIMSWEELRDLDLNLIEIGSHGVNHKRMALLENKELDIEIRRSKEILEFELKCKIEGFAFPYGELSNLHGRAISILKDAGYKYGLSTHFGRRNDGKDLYRLKRISIWDNDQTEDIANKLAGYYDWLGSKEKLAYCIRNMLKKNIFSLSSFSKTNYENRHKK